MGDVWFRKQAKQAGGGNYRTAINDTLREYINRQLLKGLLRRVV